MTGVVKPNHHQTVDKHRHGGGPLDGLAKTIGRVFQAQELLARLECAFLLPAIMPPKRGTYIGPRGRLHNLPQRAEDAHVSLVIAGFGLGQLRKNLLI